MSYGRQEHVMGRRRMAEGGGASSVGGGEGYLKRLLRHILLGLRHRLLCLLGLLLGCLCCQPARRRRTGISS